MPYHLGARTKTLPAKWPYRKKKVYLISIAILKTSGHGYLSLVTKNGTPLLNLCYESIGEQVLVYPIALKRSYWPLKGASSNPVDVELCIWTTKKMPTPLIV